ncbi:MAG: peptidoglycan-binding protein [Actinomycetota bacterium]
MGGERRNLRTFGLAMVGLVVVAMVGAGLLLGPAAGQSTDGDGADGSAATTAAPPLTETVQRSDLTENVEETASVGHGDPWAVPTDAQGIVTERHDVGTVVEPGEPLIWLDTKPLVLAEGNAPMYRTLELVGTTKSKHQQGDDVRQLQEFLIDLGFDDKGRLEADGVFGSGTRRAVKAWQKELGVTESGAVDRSRLVFHPNPVRIDAAPRLGTTFGELTVTDATQRLIAEFDNDKRLFVPEGGTVTIADGAETFSGTIVEVESTITDDGSQKLKVSIEPDQAIPTGTERAKVTATRTVSSDALVVPVRAILALAGGGYGLEVVTPSGVDLRAIEIGEVVDDLAGITGDVTEGDEVVVPNDRFGSDG